MIIIPGVSLPYEYLKPSNTGVSFKKVEHKVLGIPFMEPYLYQIITNQYFAFFKEIIKYSFYFLFYGAQFGNPFTHVLKFLLGCDKRGTFSTIICTQYRVISNCNRVAIVKSGVHCSIVIFGDCIIHFLSGGLRTKPVVRNRL